jgi:VCBS repeat-containing protein
MKRNIIFLSFCLLFSSCQSNNTPSNSSSLESKDTNKTLEVNNTTKQKRASYSYIYGKVIKGAISNATVSAYSTANQLLGKTKSNAKGEYNITLLTPYKGAIQVIAKGGTYIDEIDSKRKQASNLSLKAISSLYSNSAKVNLTPLTTIAYEEMLYQNISFSQEEIDYFNTLIAKIFTNKSFDVTKITPNITSKTKENKLYALLLALVSKLSQSDASRVNSVISELFNDIKDDKRLDSSYQKIIQALSDPFFTKKFSTLLDEYKEFLDSYVTCLESIKFSKTLYRFNDFESNSSNAFYLNEKEIEINRTKKYHISFNVSIAQSSSTTQPMHYFGFEELDENKNHINGASGTYTYLLEAQRLEAKDYNFSFIITENNLSIQTKYIRPIILSNYQANENAVATKWTNIKIEELHYKDINNSLEEISYDKTIKGKYGTLFLKKEGYYNYQLDYKTILNSKKGDEFVDNFDLNLSRVKKLTIIINNLGYNPILTLNGLEDLYLQEGFEYHKMGASAYDIEDGNISSHIIVDSSNLDNSKVGDYKIYYRVKDSDNLEAKPIFRVIHILSSEKEYNKTVDKNDKYPIYAQYMITTTAASLLSKYRRNLSLAVNKNIEHLSSYAYSFVRGAIYWNSDKSGDFLWEKGIRKEDNEYKYAGKVNGEYQKIPKDPKCADPYSTDPDCNLKIAIVDSIGMDSSHYLAKWPIFFKALKESSLNQTEAKYYNELLKNNSIRLEKNVSEFINGVYKLRNYMDGTNGVYRWNYLNRGKNYGYDSYELSNIQVNSSGLAFLDSTLVDTIFNHILDNISSYDYINTKSIQELLLRLSLKFNDSSATLECDDINSYENCKEFYLFENVVKTDLLRSFTGDDANELGSYYKVVGAHYLIMQYAFTHNIPSWKKIYYQHFKNFTQEVISTDAKHYLNLESNSSLIWKNSNIYSELHYMLWASSFLELSSKYDKRDYEDFNFTIEDEIKLRDFAEKYLFDYYQLTNKWENFDIRYYKNFK